MNNDAYQKPKWREWTLVPMSKGLTRWQVVTSGASTEKDFDGIHPKFIHVIEALPALAEIDKLRARAETAFHENETANSERAFAEHKLAELRAENEELSHELTNRSQALVNLRSDWLEARTELDKLRAENTELNLDRDKWKRFYTEMLDENRGFSQSLGGEIKQLKTKLTAATAQMEAMAEALVEISKDRQFVTSDSTGIKYELGKTESALTAHNALAQYQQFKKKVLSE